MESINNFNKGINLDINPLNQPEGTYREAYNIRIINDVGGTSVSANNVLGNTLNITIPATELIQEITITGTGASNITINGETGAGITLTSGTTPEDLYNYLNSDPAYTQFGVNYQVYYSGTHLIVIANSAIIAVGAGLTLDATYVPAQTGLEVIGSTHIRDDIYLFTTNNKTLNPGGHDPNNAVVDASSVGQIWKYVYDKVTLVGTLTLVYNNYIDFTTYWHIPPTAALGRYENAGIQRVYWTDNFNKLRSLNVADSMSLAIDPTILDVTPAVDFDVLIMQNIRNASGNVEVGCYQVAYRLKNTGGAVTTFSELSNMVFVVPEDEASNTGGARWKFYIGANEGTITTKAITWKVENLDTDFDRIEIALIKRTGVLDPGDVTLIFDESLSGNDYFEFTYDGTQEEIPMTLTEFLALSGIFTHCKTIGTKDNRLFVANVRNTYSDLDYDARAFRAFTSGGNDVKLTNSGTQATFTAAAAALIPETQDTINDYSDPTRACFFQPGTATLGGSGTNISYEFYTVAIAADRDVAGNFNVPNGTPAPWRSTNPRYDLTTLNLNVLSETNIGTTEVQTYPLAFPNAINDDIKYPQMNSLFRGYQRNEIYRFGIQFYDKAKNPFFVKWIGDIKFPDFNDSNPNSFYESGVATGITDFRPSFTANIVGYSEAFVQQLGIKFTVSIPPAISKLISGYTIVRVERTEQDTTIVSEGYVHPAELAASGNYFTTSPAVDFSGNTPNAATVRSFFITPNNSVWTQPNDTMTIKVKGILRRVTTTDTVVMGPSGNYRYYKYYTWVSTALQTRGIDQISLLGYGNQTTDTVSGTTVSNMDYDTVFLNEAVSNGIGNEAFYIRLDGNIDYTLLAGADALSKFLCTIERTLTSQYGGNTYSNRSKNDYIPCNHFRPIRTKTTTISDSFQIFGGDTFVNMWDSCRWGANFNSYTTRGIGPTKTSTTFFLPIESKMNKALEHGSYMNRMAPGNADIELREDKNYNTIFSAENKVRKFFPKPDPFITNEEFDTRFYGSEVKINGELSDSWGMFQPNNYWDAEGVYGPINAMDILRDKMYFWQDRAFGIISINPRVMITDEANGTDLQLGTGQVLQRHDYLSTELGLQNQWGMTKSGNKFFWLDVKNKKFYTYSEGPITPQSDIKGMYSWFLNNLKYNIHKVDKPVFSNTSGSDPIGLNGIRSVYDFKNNQAIFTLSDGRNLTADTSFTNNYTFVFDERLDCFVSFMNYTPKVYITNGDRFFSTNPASLSQIYMHEVGSYSSFYGTVWPTQIKLVINPNYQYTKVFDNIMYDSQALLYDNTLQSYTNFNDDTWNRIRVYNDYQNTDYQTLTVGTNLERKERTWQLAIPRNRILYNTSNSPNIFDPTELSTTDKTYGERMRDKYIIVDLYYNNTNNRLLSTNNFRTRFRQSPR